LGTKKGKVYLRDSGVNSALKVSSWNIGTNGIIEVTMSKPLPAGKYDFVLNSKGLGADVIEQGAFEVKAPQIASVDDSAGWSPGKTIILQGDFFGIKKPKVYANSVACKVTQNSMNEIAFVVPKSITSQPSEVKVIVKGVGEGIIDK
jgi:hypothetical protein